MTEGRDAIDELIHRYLSGAAEEADCERLQAALQDPDVQQAFLRAAQLEGRLRQSGGGLALADTTNAADEASRQVEAQQQDKTPLRLPLAWTAALAAAALLLILALPRFRSSPTPVQRQVTIQVQSSTEPVPDLALAVRHADATPLGTAGFRLDGQAGTGIQIHFLKLQKRP